MSVVVDGELVTRTAMFISLIVNCIRNSNLSQDF